MFMENSSVCDQVVLLLSATTGANSLHGCVTLGGGIMGRYGEGFSAAMLLT